MHSKRSTSNCVVSNRSCLGVINNQNKGSLETDKLALIHTAQDETHIEIFRTVGKPECKYLLQNYQ